MAIKKVIAIDVEAKAAIMAMNHLGVSMADVLTEADELSGQIGEMEDKLYAMANAGDSSSKEFKAISKEVGRMKKVIIDTDMAVDGMSQTLTQSVGGALQGVASGFELAQGAMGAFGAGGEAVEEALLKVQSAMAISSGIQGIRESIASFKALRTVVMSNVVVQKLLNFVMSKNPIGLIVTVVLALGTAIAFLWKPIKNLSAGLESMTEKLGFFGKVMKYTLGFILLPFVIAVKGIMMALEALGLVESDEATASKKRHAARLKQANEQLAKEKELREQRKKAYEAEQANYDELIALASAEGKNVNDLTKQKIKGSLEYQKEQVKEIQNHIKSLEIVRDTFKGMEEVYNKIIDSHKESLDEQEKSIREGELSLKLLDIKVKNEGAARAKTYQEQKLTEERRIEDLRQSLIKDDLERNTAIRRTKFERDIVDLKVSGEEKKLLEQELQRDLINIADAATPEKLRLADAEILGVQNKDMQIIESAQVTALKLDAIDKEAADRKKARNKEVASASVSVAMSGFQAVADLAKAFAGNSEKAQRRAFNIQKAANIAQATIETYKSATSAFSSFSAIPVVGVPLGIAAAGAAIAAGLANIKGIASTKFEGSGGGRPSAPAGVSIGGGGNAAQFNVVGNTGINQLADSLGNQDNVTKAYVVAGDVTTAQSLDRNKVDTATL